MNNTMQRLGIFRESISESQEMETDFLNYTKMLWWKETNRQAISMVRDEIATKRTDALPSELIFYPSAQTFPSKVIIDVMQSATHYAITNSMTIISIGSGSGILEERARLQGAKIQCIERMQYVGFENEYHVADDQIYFKGTTHRVHWVNTSSDNADSSATAHSENSKQVEAVYEKIADPEWGMQNTILVMIMPPPSDEYGDNQQGNGMGHYVDVFEKMGGNKCFLFFSGYQNSHTAIEPSKDMESWNLFSVRNNQTASKLLANVGFSVSRELIQSKCCRYVAIADQEDGLVSDLFYEDDPYTSDDFSDDPLDNTEPLPHSSIRWVPKTVTVSFDPETSGDTYTVEFPESAIDAPSTGVQPR
tara:strand:+ start:1514 stop:2599 length:1086 start_codon:yes stop_codon:yes gene_type:complete